MNFHSTFSYFHYRSSRWRKLLRFTYLHGISWLKKFTYFSPSLVMSSHGLNLHFLEFALKCVFQVFFSFWSEQPHFWHWCIMGSHWLCLHELPYPSTPTITNTATLLWLRLTRYLYSFYFPLCKLDQTPIFKDIFPYIWNIRTSNVYFMRGENTHPEMRSVG